MLVFKKVELSDIEKIRPFIINEKSISCDNSIGGIFLWRDYFDMRYCIYGDTLYLMARGYDKRTVFATPIGPDFDAAVNNIRCFSKEHGISTVFSFVSEDLLPRYEGFSYSKESFRDWFDYVYDKNEFVSLRGRKYNGQRNHINRFSRSYPDHCFEKITAENISDVILFYKSYKKTSCAANEMILEDENKTFELLYDMDPIRIEDNVFLPFLKDLFEKCDKDGGFGYLNFLRIIYPEIAYNHGTVSSESETEAKSFLYKFIILKSGIDFTISNDDFPYEPDFVEETYVELNEEWVSRQDSSDDTIVRKDDVDPDYWDEYGMPDDVGYNLTFEVETVVNSAEDYQEFFDRLFDDDFALKKEYDAVREYYEKLRQRHNDQPDEDVFNLL